MRDVSIPVHIYCEGDWKALRLQHCGHSVGHIVQRGENCIRCSATSGNRDLEASFHGQGAHCEAAVRWKVRGTFCNIVFPAMRSVFHAITYLEKEKERKKAISVGDRQKGVVSDHNSGINNTEYIVPWQRAKQLSLWVAHVMLFACTG